MAKFLPVIGEIYTTLESGVLIGAAGLAKVCGDDESASELAKSAGKAWKEYTETNLLATPINGIIQDCNGNYAESDRLKKTYLNAASSLVDGIPVVGHAKGIVHYAMGDKEKGHKSMQASSRTGLVLGAGVLTGGLGAGLVVGAGAGIGTGVAYDGAATIIDKIENGDNARLHGTIALARLDKMNPNELVGSIFGVVGDGMTGAAGAQLGRNIRTRITGQKNLQNAYEKAKLDKKTSADPAKATEVTMDAAEASKTSQTALKKQTGYATSEVCDLKTNQKGVGNSGNYNKAMRKQAYDTSGKKSGFTSKKAAGKANNYGEPSHLQTKYENVKQVNQSIPQAACAEHPAFNNLAKKNPSYKPENVYTATVYKKTNGITNTAPRCDNCSAYRSGMGNVVTDCIPDRTPVPTSGYIRDGFVGAAAGAAVYGTIVRSAEDPNLMDEEPY